MGIENNKIIKNFITKEESSLITQWVNELNFIGRESNVHLESVGKSLKGQSHMFDISNTDITNYVTTFQSLSEINKNQLPSFIVDLNNRIAAVMNLPQDHIFLQVIDMKSGGKIKAHYDASVKGYINFKCNISVVSEDYKFYIDKHSIDVEQGDLYCFEASLFKHWSDEFQYDRILLSFGFMIPYSDLGRDINDPYVRMSNRIEKYFMKQK